MKATKRMLAGIIMLLAIILTVGIIDDNKNTGKNELKPELVRDTNKVSFTPTQFITDPLSIAVRLKN